MKTICVILALGLWAFVPASAQETVTDYDGNVYHVVKIGTQKWLKENLKSLHYSDGAPIPDVASYDDSDSLANIYGRLYTWDAAMRDSTVQGTQGVAPLGWHVPSDSEWTVVENFLGGAPVAGGKMKDSVTGFWNAPNTGADNSSGFTALPGGEYDGYSNPQIYALLYQYAVFWTSTQSNSTQAVERYLSYNSAACLPYSWYKVMKYSVRCLKSMTYLSPQLTPGIQSIFPGQSAVFSLVLPSVIGYHGTVNLSATVAPVPATGTITCTFDPTVINPADSSILTVTASGDAAPGRYVISITTADSVDTLAGAATTEVVILGSGQALCVGCPGSLMNLVRESIPQADSVNRLPPQLGSNYQYLVMADSGRPADSAVVRAFIQQGGNILLTGLAPADLAGGNTLSGIAGWLGAQTHGLYTGAGIKVISTYANPFGVATIIAGDTLGTAVNGYSRLGSIGAGATLVARYGTVNTIIGGLYNEYGTGRCLWLTGGAGFSVKQDSLIRGFLTNPELGVSEGAPPAAVGSSGLRLAVSPNPSSNRISILYQLPLAAKVSVDIYNLTGQLVKTFDEGTKPAGYHAVNWDVKTQSSGVYLYRLTAGSYTLVKKLMIVH